MPNTLFGKLLILSVWIVAFGCSEKNDPAFRSGRVSFSFVSKEGVGSDGRSESDEVPVFVSYTVRKKDGSAISNKIELYLFNGNYVTQPVHFETGEYQLEQFLILNAENKSIYAAPLEDSEMATFVEHPLPLSFKVKEDETTDVVPEVLAVEEHTPYDFGYMVFGFTVKDITAIKLPEIPGSISSIHYMLTNENTVIEGEGNINSPILDLKDHNLNEGIWTLRIFVWLSSDPQKCYPEVYHFRGQVSFTGKLIRLPSLEDRSWVRLLYHEVTAQTTLFKIFRPVDPRKNHRVIVQFFQPTPEWHFHGGFADLALWKGNDVACDEYYTHAVFDYNPIWSNGMLTLEADLPDAAECPFTDMLDSYIFFNSCLNPDHSEDLFLSSFFYWWIADDGTVLACPPSQNPGGKVGATSASIRLRKEKNVFRD